MSKSSALAVQQTNSVGGKASDALLPLCSTNDTSVHREYVKGEGVIREKTGVFVMKFACTYCVCVYVCVCVCV